MIDHQPHVQHQPHLLIGGDARRKQVGLLSVTGTDPVGHTATLTFDGPVVLLSAPPGGTFTINGANGSNWQQLSAITLTADFVDNVNVADGAVLSNGTGWLLPGAYPANLLVT